MQAAVNIQQGQFQQVQPFTENNPVRKSRLHFTKKVFQTLGTVITTPIQLGCRIVKLLTWDAGKAVVYKISGYHNEASDSFLDAYLRTCRCARDILLIPTLTRAAFNDAKANPENVVDDLPIMREYLKVNFTGKIEQFSSYMYGTFSFRTIRPEGVKEFAAESDGTLNTVMASHFLKPGVIAINFGIPNVATFNTEKKQDGSVQTVKVDAKSLKRDMMAYHPTNGKIQSGIFFVPTNLPPEALERYKEAAKKLQGSADITCVNTNCKVLQEAGFSIEGKRMEEVVFPTTFMEHLLFRNVYYTDSQGKKHKVHFDIINTTPNSLEEHYDKIDMAVVGTRLRHRQRNADTEENKKARGVAARALIKVEEERLKEGDQKLRAEDQAPDLTKRKITVSVPSCLGNAFARIWGRHTIFEIDLADKKQEIAERIKDHAKLRPFPQQNPSLATRIKKSFLFSKTMINFLRRHMMGRQDTLFLNTQDLFSHLKGTKGERLNYVLLDDKVVLARVNANKGSDEVQRKTADWALSKHALLAGRQEVRCSGEIWYDEASNRFMINSDSGTYIPTDDHVKATVELANRFFQCGTPFELAPKAAEVK